MMPPIDFAGWIEEHAHLLRPPVGNKVLFEWSENFIVMAVGGPNQRADFHIDPYEELFFQVKGDMRLNVMTAAGPETVRIREGQLWLLPAGVPHSPQRAADSVGLVVERVREEGTPERFAWYCPACHHLVHEVELQVGDIVADLPPLFAAFLADERARTCPACGTIHPGK